MRREDRREREERWSEIAAPPFFRRDRLAWGHFRKFEAVFQPRARLPIRIGANGRVCVGRKAVR